MASVLCDARIPCGKSWLVAAAAYALLLGVTATAHAQATSAPVRIGILNDQTGTYADFGGRTSVEAARMAVEDAGGKVLGRAVEIVAADHQNKPDLGSAIARQWFDNQGPHELRGGTCGPATRPRARQGDPVHRPRNNAADERGLLAHRLSLGIRYLFAGGRHRESGGG
jgi:hypothetical protein